MIRLNSAVYELEVEHQPSLVEPAGQPSMLSSKGNIEIGSTPLMIKEQDGKLNIDTPDKKKDGREGTELGLKELETAVGTTHG